MNNDQIKKCKKITLEILSFLLRNKKYFEKIISNTFYNIAKNDLKLLARLETRLYGWNTLKESKGQQKI